MKNFMKTLVVVLAVIIVAKTGFGYAQDYACTYIENQIESQANESLKEDTYGYLKCDADVEFINPFMVQINTKITDTCGLTWTSDTNTYTLIDLL